MHKIFCGRSQDIPRFWAMMGPFFASRRVAKELGISMYDEKDICWIILYEDEKRQQPPSVKGVRGFCGVRVGKKKIQLIHDYVLPEYRSQGLFTRLYNERAAWLEQTQKGKSQEVTLKSAESQRYGRHGFQAVRENGRYVTMRREG